MFGHFLYSKQAILEQKRKIVNGQKIENFKRELTYGFCIVKICGNLKTVSF